MCFAYVKGFSQSCAFETLEMSTTKREWVGNWMTVVSLLMNVNKVSVCWENIEMQSSVNEGVEGALLTTVLCHPLPWPSGWPWSEPTWRQVLAFSRNTCEAGWCALMGVILFRDDLVLPAEVKMLACLVKLGRVPSSEDEFTWNGSQPTWWFCLWNASFQIWMFSWNYLFPI